MSKRDYCAEILSKKSRLFRDVRWEALKVQLNSLFGSADVLRIVDEHSEYLEKASGSFLIDQQATELYNYFPIRCVALTEGYFRIVYASLINYGAPFRDNAMKFDNNIRYSINTALQLQSNSISIGEFISHLLPTNNLDDINKNMSILLGTDFYVELKKEFFDMPRLVPLFGGIEGLYDSLLMNLKEMFKRRHIFCHEAGGIKEQHPPNPEQFLNATAQFLSTTESLIEKLTADSSKED